MDPFWATLPDEKLLELRLCDLGLSLKGSPLQAPIDELYRELKARGIRFQPFFWLADEWFTPDRVPGIAVPFYMAHPRLAELEGNQMLEVEGGTREWCLRILRHETGHALDNAYVLRRRRRWQRLFGKSSQPYPDHYAPRPYSRRFVVHLESWYAQSHPDEDFAETFAVWLSQDEVTWRKRYAGWPALKKLEYVDELMHEVSGQKPAVRLRRKPDEISGLAKTLREHYARKREHYQIESENFYDRDLRRVFSSAPEFATNLSADRFLTRVRKDVRRLVARWTGVYQYTIDQVLEEMLRRCRELNLRLAGSEEQARLDFAVILTAQTLNYLHSGRNELAL